MKAAIAVMFLVLISTGKVFAQECKKPNEGFYVAQIVSKLEVTHTSKWKIDDINEAIWIRKRGIRIEIRESGVLLSNYQVIQLPVVTIRKTKALYQKVMCSRQSRNMKLIIRTLKALGINWRRWP